MKKIPFHILNDHLDFDTFSNNNPEKLLAKIKYNKIVLKCIKVKNK